MDDLDLFPTIPRPSWAELEGDDFYPQMERMPDQGSVSDHETKEEQWTPPEPYVPKFKSKSKPKRKPESKSKSKSEPDPDAKVITRFEWMILLKHVLNHEIQFSLSELNAIARRWAIKQSLLLQEHATLFEVFQKGIYVNSSKREFLLRVDEFLRMVGLDPKSFWVAKYFKFVKDVSDTMIRQKAHLRRFHHVPRLRLRLQTPVVRPNLELVHC